MAITSRKRTSGPLHLRAYTEALRVINPSGSSPELNLSEANVFDITLSEDTVSPSFTSAPEEVAFSFLFIARQDGAGERVLSWPASVKWPYSGAVPSLAQDPDAVTMYLFTTVDGGVSWIGNTAGEDFL